MPSANLDILIRLVLPIFELFKDFHVAILLAASLIALCFLALFRFSITMARPLARDLRRLRGEIVQFRRPTDFAAAFASIDKRFSERRLLRHAWRKFRETLVLPPAETEGVVRQTQPAAQYLNMAAAESAGFNLRFYQALPNYFVGVGLIFTFLGLVAALYFASAAVGSQNVQEAQAALGDLLRAATFKFLTSIAGLFSSLILSITVRLMTQEVNREFGQLCEALEERMRLVTPLVAALDQLRATERQTARLADLPEATATALAAKMEDGLPALLDHALAPVDQGLVRVANALSATSHDGLVQLVEEFQNAMNKTAGKEVAALAETLAEIRNSLRMLNQTMMQAGSNFGDRVDGAAHKLESLTAGAGQGLAEQFAKMVEQLTGASKPITEMTDKLTQTAREIGQVSSNLARGQDLVQGLAGTLVEATQALKSSWSDHRTRFEDIDKALASSFQVFASGTDAHRRNVEDFVREIDAQFTRALTALTTGVDELHVAVEAMERGLRSGATRPDGRG